MEELKGCAAAMAWDADMDNIDVDEDDGKQWVPMMPQMMKFSETPRPTRMGAPMLPVMPMPLQQMTMYMLHLTQGGLAEQASSPIVILVQSPTVCGPLIFKENIGEGARQRDEETTADDDEESKLTELSSMPKVWRERKAPLRKRGVPNNAAMVMLSELRSRLCNRCEAQSRPCMPRSKGAEPLEACEGCYTRKLSCQMRGRGGRTKKSMEKRGAKKLRDSRESKEESNASGKEWLKNFSTMKVGPPRHAKPAAKPRQASLGAKVTCCRTTSRLAGLEAKRWLHKLREFHTTLMRLLN